MDSVIMVLYLLLSVVLFILCFRILDRTGLSKWLVLLFYIPLVNCIVFWKLAFARWPAIDHSHGEAFANGLIIGYKSDKAGDSYDYVIGWMIGFYRGTRAGQLNSQAGSAVYSAEYLDGMESELKADELFLDTDDYWVSYKDGYKFGNEVGK